MGFSDIASRIGAIQGTLATISGSTATKLAEPAAAKNVNAPSGVGMAASGTGTGFGTGLGTWLTGNSGTEDFTKILQDAMDPAVNKPVAEPKGTSSGQPASPAAGVAKAAPVKPDDALAPTDGSATGADVVRESKKYLGVPYVWGGNNPDIGLDCSSFVQHTFRDLGVELPRVARDQAKQGTEVASLAQAKPGDLIVTRGGGHIGIYLGQNKMIHAPRPGENVSIRKLFETDAQIMTIRRIVPAESVAPAPVAAQAVPGAQVKDFAVKAAELTASAQRAAFNTVVKDS